VLAGVLLHARQNEEDAKAQELYNQARQAHIEQERAKRRLARAVLRLLERDEIEEPTDEQIENELALMASNEEEFVVDDSVTHKANNNHILSALDPDLQDSDAEEETQTQAPQTHTLTIMESEGVQDAIEPWLSGARFVEESPVYTQYLDDVHKAEKTQGRTLTDPEKAVIAAWVTLTDMDHTQLIDTFLLSELMPGYAGYLIENDVWIKMVRPLRVINGGDEIIVRDNLYPRRAPGARTNYMIPVAYRAGTKAADTLGFRRSQSLFEAWITKNRPKALEFAATEETELSDPLTVTAQQRGALDQERKETTHALEEEDDDSSAFEDDASESELAGSSSDTAASDTEEKKKDSSESSKKKKKKQHRMTEAQEVKDDHNSDTETTTTTAAAVASNEEQQVQVQVVDRENDDEEYDDGDDTEVLSPVDNEEKKAPSSQEGHNHDESPVSLDTEKDALGRTVLKHFVHSIPTVCVQRLSMRCSMPQLLNSRVHFLRGHESVYITWLVLVQQLLELPRKLQ
jgi:hypothetical protein